MGTESYADIFERLGNTWRRETGFLSNPYSIIEHPACRQLVSIGKPLLPLIFEQMAPDSERRPRWEWILTEITGVEPQIDRGSFGRFYDVERWWLDWAFDNGYLDCRVPERVGSIRMRWERQLMADTNYETDINVIIAHPAFRELAHMGEPIIPAIVGHLALYKKIPHWDLLLREITGNGPDMPADDMDNVMAIAQWWQEWARQNGYLPTTLSID